MGKVQIGNSTIQYDDEFSFRDFSGRDLKDLHLDNKIIYASCFSQEIPDRNIFPDNMSGVRFYNCNLDNVFIPPGNVVTGGSQRKFKVQNDLRDWEIDQSNQPTKVLNEIYWASNGYSVDPIDIPAQPIKSIDEIKKVQSLDLAAIKKLSISNVDVVSADSISAKEI